MDAIEAAFLATNEGLDPIYSMNDMGKESSFLATFQRVATFEGIYAADLTEAQRAVKVARQNAKRAKYPRAIQEYERKLADYNAREAAAKLGKKGQFKRKQPVRPIDPDEPEVTDLVTEDCQHGDATHRKACAQFYDYIEMGLLNTTWLDAFAMIFLPRVLGRPVHVYSLEWRTWQKYEALDEAPRKQEPISLLLNVFHYAPLVKCSRSGI
jgi:hypothetical protein